MDAEAQTTPDELLLELMDLVQLAFPAAIDTMTLTFVENEDGRRPALTNLDARGPVDAVARPALGHDDNRVLDSINGLLAELADATERQAGIRVHSGTLTVKTGADQERNVTLGDAHGEVMTRRFDASELRWLLFTPALFNALNHSEAREQQLVALSAERLVGTRRFDIDMARGIITFTGPDVSARVFRFELLGSHSEDTGGYLWGWANPSTPPALTRKVDGLRARSVEGGLRMLTEGSFACPPLTAQRLALHAAVQIGADAVYLAPFVGRSTTSKDGKSRGVMMLALWPA